MRKIYILLISMLAMTFLVACGDDDDDLPQVSNEWKQHQANVFNKAKAEYPMSVQSGGKSGVSLYYKYSDDLSYKPESSTRMGTDGKPYISDTVICRYVGWYYDLEDKKVQFDSTESGNIPTPYTVILEQQAVIEGWITMLQEMRKGEEVTVAIPYAAAYGEYTNGGIPGYTTLFFTIKIVNIKPANPNEWED